MKRLLTLLFVSLVLIGCALKPEDAARTAFVKWADEINKVPYQNVHVNVIDNDETFATVKIAAEFRAAPEAPWIEQETKTDCKKVGSEWQCEKISELGFPAIPTEVSDELIKSSKVGFLTEFDVSSNAHIFVVDIQSKRKRKLAELADCRSDDYPVLAPSGKQLVFMCWGDEAGMYLIDLDGKNLIRLTKYVVLDHSWSPDSKEIVFGGIYTINSDGSNLRQLLAKGSSPSWSPDGREIAFAWDGSFCEMNSDGSNARCLQANNIGFPVWSPNGRQIAFIQSANGATNVWLTDSKSNNQMQLTWTNLVASRLNALAWSPDGKWIVVYPETVGRIRPSLLVDAEGKKIYDLGTDSIIQAIINSWRR